MITKKRHFRLDSSVARKAQHEIKNVTYDNFSMVSRDSLYNFRCNFSYELYASDILQERFSGISNLLSSWYCWNADTMNLRVNIDNMSPGGLLVKLWQDSALIIFEKSFHDDVKAYRVSLQDTSSQYLQVPCHNYELILSQIPDPALKEKVYDFVSLKSDNYYLLFDDDRYPILKTNHAKAVKQRTNFQCFFRSNYQAN